MAIDYRARRVTRKTWQQSRNEARRIRSAEKLAALAWGVDA
jgi:hypothetical protein